MPSPHSETTRLEAFSDGVFAIIITIMVLELHVPHEATFEALRPLVPIFLSYVLSFLYLAIYWNNHHHLLHATEGITASVMWANMHLLFWLSLIPFATAWVGVSHGEAWPPALYGFVLLMAALAYSLLQWRIIAKEGHESAIAKALRKDRKGKASLFFYCIAIGAAFVHYSISYALFSLVALMWVIPDKRLAPLFDHVDEENL